MAIPAKAFSEDWVFILAQFTIPLVAPLVIVFYLPFFYRLQITTAYDFLENRFNRPVRLFGSVSFLLFQLGRMGIVIALPALALATVSGINVYGCIVTIGVLATLYTMMGGMEAVIWTDVLQVVVLIGGALLSLVIILAGIHLSPAEAYQEALEMGKLHTFNWSWDYTRATVWVVVVGNFMANLVPLYDGSDRDSALYDHPIAGYGTQSDLGKCIDDDSNGAAVFLAGHGAVSVL